MWDMKNLTFFDMQKTPLKIDKPIRLIELFAGVGSQAKALKRLGANFEHYRICEFDKYAIKSYNAVHGTDFETSDITKITADDLGIVDTDKYTYICCYSFPCQDLSLAGKQKLMAKGSGTRSSLLWEVERLLNECTELPQILLMENVTQVHGKKNKEHFDEWLAFLESKGYSNYWKDLNAKNFGIPQNRNRTFMVSVLGDYTYEFPEEFPLELRLKDMLEESVDEKFYLSDAMINFFQENTIRQQEKGNGFKFQPTDGSGIGKAVTTRAGGRMDDNFIQVDPVRLGGIFDTEKSKHQAGSIWDKETIAPTVDTMQGGYRQPLVMDDSFPCSARGKQVASAIRATIHKQGSRNLMQNLENGLGYEGVIEPKIQKVCQLDGAHEQSGRVYSADGISPTIMSNSHGKTDGGYTAPKVILEGSEPFICASRGRNPENPSDRTAGIPLKQIFEANLSGCTNTLTTVQKDNYVCEPQVLRAERTEYGKAIRKQYESGKIEEKIGNMREMKPRTDGVSNTITTVLKDNYLAEPLLRIRKLTPKECWRLMGFDDTDFEKAATVNSNTQLYKQAGNSIVVDVLYYIFREML